MRHTPTLLRSGLSCFLFIYLVREQAATCHRYCTVLTYGRNLETAERIAINRVHQQGLHSVRADTATASIRRRTRSTWRSWRATGAR